MHTNSKLIFKKHALSYFNSNTRVLEFGPDSFPSTYQKIVNNDPIT